MAAIELEISVFPPAPVITATCELREGLSTAGAPEVPAGGVPTNGYLQTDQDLIVRIEWSELDAAARFLQGGTWVAEATLEQVGGGVSTRTQNQISNGGGPYLVNLQFDHPLTAGLYRVFASLQWNFDNGDPGPITGFTELGTIKVYNEV